MLNVFLFQWTLITKQKISDETDDDNMLILYYYIHTYIHTVFSRTCNAQRESTGEA